MQKKTPTIFRLHSCIKLNKYTDISILRKKYYYIAYHIFIYTMLQEEATLVHIITW